MTQPYQKTRQNRAYFIRLLSVFVLCTMLFSQNTFAQQSDPRNSLQDYCEPMENIEFFLFKPDVSFTREQFMLRVVDLLKLTPGSEMKFVRTQTNDIGVTSTFYQQYVNGYKVKDADMVVNEQNGRVKYVNGRYMTTEPMASSKAVSANQALEISLNQINSKDYLWNYPEAEAAYRRYKKDSNATYKPVGELLYIPDATIPYDKQQFRLVWHYAIHVNPQTESFELFVDAESGLVVNKIPLTFSCSAGTSTTLWNGARTLYTQLSSGSYRTLGDCNAAQVNTYNGNGNDNGVGATYYTDADNAWSNTALGQYIAQTHWGNKQTRDYYAAIHSREGYDGAGADFVTYINPGYTGNAYWTGSGTSFGGSSTGASPYVTLDVCGHEHTHGMIDNSSNLTYSNESGALNESFADCIGEAVEEYTLGSADWIHRAEISGGNRSFISPNAKGQPDTYLGTYWYTGTADNGGVHTNSGVQNYWYYLLSVGGSGTNDNGDAYSVTGITIDKARLIAYDCMIALSSGSQYTNARSVSIQKAKDRYGNCSNEAIQCTNAWRAVGVGNPYIAPLPITINVSTSATSTCNGGSITVTASGASTYTWAAAVSYGSGNPKSFTVNSTTTYTVTGTDVESCTGTKSFTLFGNPLPTVSPGTTDNDICLGGTTTLTSGSNATLNSLIAAMDGTNGFSANVFDVHAYNNITITDFQMNIVTGDSAEVWYNPGGYGNANVTTTTGWFKLGSTVPITPAGAGNLTLIPTTVNLTIPAGSTYGIIVACNGSNRYSNGTLVGAIWENNPDLYITEGHGGSAFGGTFNLSNSPRCFNGGLIYRTNFTNFSWLPSASLSSATSSAPTATPTATTTYTLTATDGNGCTGTGAVTVYVNDGPDINAISATPESLCQGGSTNLSVSATSLESMTILTAFNSNNSNGGNVFDITASKDISIYGLGINVSTGTQAEVWYKPGGYGGANLFSSTGWTKVGNTVTITPMGQDISTYVPLSTTLNIPAGQTYGIAVVANGVVHYTNGGSVGSMLASNPDITIFEGHGGTGFGGTFSFSNAPRDFNGRFYYTVDNNIASYSWSGGVITNANTATPVGTPVSSVTYTVTVTDGDGCTATELQRVYVGEPLQIQINSASTSVCPGVSQALTTSNMNSAQTDEILTQQNSNNGYGPNGGVVFDVTTTRAITLTSVKMNVDDDATQAEVWYKAGGYGGANLTSSTGWTKLGATVSISSLGLDKLTTIPISVNLSIPANTTYGLAIVCNGGVNYINGSSVGAVHSSQPGISIKEGHGGAGFGGTFNFINSPRVFSGSLVYSETVNFSSYSWLPSTSIIGIASANPTVTPTANTSYSVTVTDANGCTGTASFGVQVMDSPTGIASASPTTACAGSTVTLNYSPLTGSQCNGVVQTGFAGTYVPATWSTILTNSNGTVNSAGAPSTVNITSSNGLTGNGTTAYQHSFTCAGYLKFNWSYTTNDGPTFDYPRYSVNGGSAIVLPGFKTAFGNSNNQAGSFSLPVNAGDIVQIQMYSSDNFGGAATLTVTNFKAPYQTTTTQSVAWYTTPTGGASLSGANPYSYIPSAGTITHYAQVTNTTTGCTNATRIATNSITIDPLPVVSIAPATVTICAGTTTTLTASGASTYTWLPGGLTGASVTVSPTTTTTYTVTGTSANGCTATATRIVTVNPLPVITGSANPGIICPGAAVTLACTTPSVNVNWQPGNLTGTPVVVNPVVQTTYTVTVTSTVTGCTNAQTFVILMNPTPSVAITSTPTNATICSGGSVSLTASGATSYVWQPGGATTTSINASTAGTYTVTGTNASGCTASAVKTVIVNALPTVGASATATTLCNGQSSTLTGSGAATYTWMPGSLSGTSVNVTPTTTTTYTVTGTNANGCTATSTIIITVNSIPTMSTTITNATLCNGQSTSITGTGASTYSWQPGALSGSTVNVTPTTTTTYTVTGTAANGCTATATRLVTVNTLPTVGTTITNATLCNGSSTSITGTGASTYSWQPGALSGTTVNVTPTTTTTYTVTGTAANGCTATATRLVTVNTNPTVVANATFSTINCPNATTLTVTGASTYTWMPGSLSGSSVVVSPSSTTTYTVTGTATNGCTATSTKTITVIPCNSATLNLKALVQGYYIGGGTMTPVLNNQGMSNPTSQADSLTVELHQGTAPYATVYSFKGVQQVNGSITCTFPGAAIGSSYYIVLKHRNALETWSSTPVLAATSYSYDFTTASSKAFGGNQVNLGAGVFGLYSGDLNQDLTIDAFDYLIIEPDIIAGSGGYLSTDVNGDGSIDVFDYLVMDPNITNGVGAFTP